MLKPVKVKALPEYRLWIEYNDGVSGEVDLSDLVGQDIYRTWKKPGFFETVHIDDFYDGAIVWDEMVEVCSYDLYMKITGKAWEELPIDVQMTGGDPLIEPVEVRALPGHRIWIAYEDGKCGEIDLSDVVGKGVFKIWDKPGFFENVHISSHGSIAWNDELELCPHALYLDLTGIRWEALYIDLTGKSREELTKLANLKFDHA